MVIGRNARLDNSCLIFVGERAEIGQQFERTYGPTHAVLGV